MSRSLWPLAILAVVVVFASCSDEPGSTHHRADRDDLCPTGITRRRRRTRRHRAGSDHWRKSSPPPIRRAASESAAGPPEPCQQFAVSIDAARSA